MFALSLFKTIKICIYQEPVFKEKRYQSLALPEFKEHLENCLWRIPHLQRMSKNELQQEHSLDRFVKFL